MSHLKNIIVELHNCLHELDSEVEIPMVWSREFQRKLALNASHWNADQRRASHVSVMDFQDEEDSNIRIPYDDDQPELQSSDVTYNPNFDGKLNPANFGVEEEEETGRKFKTKWGSAFRQYLNSGDPKDEEEESYSYIDVDYDSDEFECSDCRGKGCQTCGDTGRNMDVKSEEEEQEDNITTDPDKVARAKKVRDRAYSVRDRARSVRDRARSVRDKAVGVRDKAKDQRDEEKGLGGFEDKDENKDGEMGANGKEGSEGQEWDDPDYQGVIRTIPNSHLVSKRQQEDGTFIELWQYNIGDDFKKELKQRRAILAGTDIPINKMRSPDNSQTYELWTIGNGQLLKIQGLPN